MSFVELSSRAQVVRIRRVALAALRQYPVEPTKVRLVQHEFNTTFRVDTADGRRFALRVNVNSAKSMAAVAAEVAWLTALRADTDLLVPEPLPTRSGRLHTSEWCEEIGRDLPVVMTSWLPGRELDEPTPDAVGALGLALATLHDHAEGWSLPAGATLPRIDDPFLDAGNRIPDDDPLITAEVDEVVSEVIRHADAAFDSLRRRHPLFPLHADLHGGNVKWFRRRLAVFDFDDLGIGLAVQDPAIARYYLRDDSALEDALVEGYGEVRLYPDATPEEFEALVASRNVLILSDVMASVNSAHRELLTWYLPNTVTKLRHYLATGRYRHRVDGLIPVPG